jgi:dipeptidyl aminopeptidase/acylaminoacyl peptidase
MWVMHGLKDPLLPFNQSEILYEKLKSLGGVAKITIAPDAVHDFKTIVNASTATTRSSSGGQEQTTEGTGPSWDEIEKFIRTHLK